MYGNVSTALCYVAPNATDICGLLQCWLPREPDFIGFFCNCRCSCCGQTQLESHHKIPYIFISWEPARNFYFESEQTSQIVNLCDHSLLCFACSNQIAQNSRLFRTRLLSRSHWQQYFHNSSLCSTVTRHKCVDHLVMMSLVAVQFEAIFFNSYCFRNTRCNTHSCLLSHFSMSKVFIR